MLREYAALARFVAGLVVVALVGWGGYSYRDAMCRADAAESEAAVADALAQLARQYAAADAAAADARARARSLVAQRVEANVDVATSLPDRGCGWTADERRLLDDTYCAGFPAAPGCVPREVSDPRAAPASR